MIEDLESRIFKINSEQLFEESAMEIFRFQSQNNLIYKQYIAGLGIDPSEIHSVPEIPFLPIEMFKYHKIYTEAEKSKAVFESSGTAGMKRSKHYIAKTSLYEKSFNSCLNIFYGDLAEACILALLPSYLEQENSSLVYMMDHIIRNNNHPESGFYLTNFSSLVDVIKKRIYDEHETILLGVSFALLDLAEQFPMQLSDNITIMETGGMKGRRKEITRDELHEHLKEAFQISVIHSEYGMTEMLSQAYSKKDKRFYPPPWLKIACRDIYDPLSLVNYGQTGGINILDLANIYSCSFISTSDLGQCYNDGSFEVIGRYDQSDIRGCNLMSELT